MILPKPVNVLLVDDDIIDVEAIHRGFEELKLLNPITVAHNGFDALDILRGANGQTKIPKPYIILLDINMPQMNGLEFLEKLRADADLRSSTVFVLTTSNNERDRLGAYDKNVAGYILKSNAGESFREAVSLLEHYWQLVELPKDA